MSTTATEAVGRHGGEEIARLVARAASGDERAWEALVAEFGGMVWAIARGHRLDPADAADAAQATWLRLLGHLGRLHEPGRVGAWLATTARRESLRLLRQSKRQVLTGDDDFEEDPALEATPEASLLLAERDAAVWTSFGRLRPRDQALLRLLADEHGYDEISAALDMPIGSIGPTRARALERLRRELERDGALALVAA